MLTTTTTGSPLQETPSPTGHLQIETMAVAIAHDIKQPLSAITAAIAAMSAQRLSQEAAAMIKIVESSVREINRMTATLVDCAILAGQIHLRPEPIGVAGLMDELRQQHVLPAREAGINLRVISQPLQLRADRDLLSRALRNLIANAITHSRASKVLVRARQRGEACEIDVLDNGIGIASQHMNRMWDLGWRGSTSSTGTGLGLYAARTFVEAMHGTIEARSEPSRGTMFRVRLPGPVAHLPLTTAISSKPEDELTGTLIGLLDDDQAVLEATRAAFSVRGARVIAHTKPLYFLHDIALLPNPPDLLVVDFLLGGGHTVELWIKVLQGRYGPDLPVVILTAHPNHPEIQRLSGVIVLEKPLSRQHIERLCCYLRKQLSWHELQQATEKP